MEVCVLRCMLGHSRNLLWSQSIALILHFSYCLFAVPYFLETPSISIDHNVDILGNLLFTGRKCNFRICLRMYWIFVISSYVLRHFTTLIFDTKYFRLCIWTMKSDSQEKWQRSIANAENVWRIGSFFIETMGKNGII